MSPTGGVAATFAQIMAERHPGTRWLPVERADRDATSGAGKLVAVLPAPHDLDAIGDLPATAPGAPHVDHVDGRGEKALTLGGM
jgi:hypothetical protein